MTLPVFLADDLLTPAAATLHEGEVARLGGAEGRHASTVRRLAPGERLDVVDGRGLRLTCLVEGADRDGLDLRVLSLLEEQGEGPALVLVQALAKAGRDEQAVETATEIGVDTVIPWQADRSIVRWSGSKAERARSRWSQVARAAAKQSRRSRLPEVLGVLDTTRLARWVGEVTGRGGTVFVCHEEGTRRLSEVLAERGESLGMGGEVAVVVGPEGGIAAPEVEALRGAGAEVVLLGPTVLRSASAGPAAAVLLSAALHRW